ncbi:MAG TPA: YcnI family protein [Propionibacteriaceae bacterium]
MTDRSTSTARSRARATTRLARTGAVAVLAAAGLVPGAGAAAAHVRVKADSTTTGSFSALTFRVPNESDTAATVKLAVQLPQESPFVFVSIKPVPGWTAKTTEAALPKPVEGESGTITKAIRTITWTADDKDAGIGGGEYQEFSISVGPLPKPGTVLLPVVQTYSDGEVSSWIEPTPASGAEPESPAPVLEVTAAATEGGAGGEPAGPGSPATESPAAESPAAPASPTTSTQSSGSSDGLARGLAGTGLAVAIGSLVAALAGRRGRGSA